MGDDVSKHAKLPGRFVIAFLFSNESHSLYLNAALTVSASPCRSLCSFCFYTAYNAVAIVRRSYGRCYIWILLEAMMDNEHFGFILDLVPTGFVTKFTESY